MSLAFIAFVLGILALHFESVLPHWGFTLCLPWVGVLVWLRPDLRFPGLFLCGYLLALMQAQVMMSDRLLFEAGNLDCELRGRITSLPDVGIERTRFEFDVDEQTGCEGQRVPSRVRIAWYESRADVKASERWSLRVRLKPPAGLMNPGGFDYEGWLFRHRIGAVGYVRDTASAVRLEPAAPGYIVAQRQTLLDGIRGVLANHPQEGLVTALILGHQDHINDAQWQVLNTTGTGHLIAISGMHVVLVAAAVAAVVGWVWSWFPGGLLRLPRPQVAALAGLVAAVGYSALAGFSIPTQRAVIMVAVAAWIAFRRGQVRPGTALMSAGFAVLAWDTFAVFDAGFWLSFAAVAIIFYTALNRLHRGRIFTWFGLQLAISVALIPLTVGFFQQASLVAPLANLVAIPVIGTLVTPLALVGAFLVLIVPPLGAEVLRWVAETLGLIWHVLEAMSGWPGASVSFSSLPDWVFVCALVGIIWLLAPRGIPLRTFGIVWLAPLFLVQPERAPLGQATVTVLDVGQGLAVVVETAAHVLLYDTGPRLSESFDAASAAIIPYLRSRGIAAPDLVVVGHGDSDHRGGLPTLRAAHLLTAGLVSQHAAAYFPEASYCQRGQHWRWEGVDFTVLHPSAGYTSASENDKSCVIQVRAGSHSLLLSGDIERGAERALVESWGSQLQSDVLVVPHHGSRTSSTPLFIDTVDPNVALVAAGFLNRHGHPKPDIVFRYLERGISVWSTAQHGAITLALGAGDAPIAPHGYRERGRYYWHRITGEDSAHRF